MKKFLTALLLFALPATAQAISLSEAARIALERNPGLHRTERSIETAEESLKIARANKGLSVTVSGSANASKAEGTATSESLSTRLRSSLTLYSGNRLENQIDSAENMFRKELRYGRDLNNKIAGSKGLQKIFELRKMPDSVAKYASLSYELNDSAYSLSEMENIQKFQASYNYNHHKLMAEQSEKKAQQSLNMLTIIIAFVIILFLLAFYWFRSYRAKRKAEILQYQKDLERLEKLQTELQDICSEERLSPLEIFEKKHEEIVAILDRVAAYKRKTKQPLATLEDRLANAPVVKRLKDYVNANPYQKASQADFAELRGLLNEEMPHFYTTLNTPHYTLSEIEYDVSILLRVRFSPMDIHKLTGMSPSYVSNMRSRLLLRVYGVDGSPADYDMRVLAIS